METFGKYINIFYGLMTFLNSKILEKINSTHCIIYSKINYFNINNIIKYTYLVGDILDC